jgi:hypothetical protein
MLSPLVLDPHRDASVLETGEQAVKPPFHLALSLEVPAPLRDLHADPDNKNTGFAAGGNSGRRGVSRHAGYAEPLGAKSSDRLRQPLFDFVRAHLKTGPHRQLDTIKAKLADVLGELTKPHLSPRFGENGPSSRLPSRHLISLSLWSTYQLRRFRWQEVSSCSWPSGTGNTSGRVGGRELRSLPVRIAISCLGGLPAGLPPMPPHAGWLAGARKGANNTSTPSGHTSPGVCATSSSLGRAVIRRLGPPVNQLARRCDRWLPGGQAVGRLTRQGSNGHRSPESP